MKSKNINSLLREHVSRFLQEGLRSVNAKRLVNQSLMKSEDFIEVSDIYGIKKKFNLSKFRNIFVIGAGKVSAPMAEAIKAQLTEHISDGIVITKYGFDRELNCIKCFVAGHPLPDENGVIATQKIFDICKTASGDDLIINLISGGASALLVKPAGNISLDDKIKITKMLLNGGASIFELNTVRKHISAVKGGKLAEMASPATMINLIISDVIDDDMDTIASGPTVQNSTRKQDSLVVLKKLNLLDKAPCAIINYLEEDDENEYSNPGVDRFNSINNFIIGNNSILLNSIKDLAISNGYRAEIFSNKISGEARTAGKRIIETADKYKNRNGSYCLISGGETTVRVKGTGIGGRNQEMCLAAAIELQGKENIVFLCAGTDGNDGETDAAGAICDCETNLRAEGLGLSLSKYLNNNDSYNFFKQLQDLIITGPTQTNVMDVQILLIKND